MLDWLSERIHFIAIIVAIVMLNLGILYVVVLAVNFCQ